MSCPLRVPPALRCVSLSPGALLRVPLPLLAAVPPHWRGLCWFGRIIPPFRDKVLINTRELIQEQSPGARRARVLGASLFGGGTGHKAAGAGAPRGAWGGPFWSQLLG